MSKGKIVQVMGPVVDVVFENGQLPDIKDALEVENNGKRCVMEVSQHLGNNVVRCIMLSASEGLQRDREVTATGNDTDIIPLKEDCIYKAIIVPQDVKEGNFITINVEGSNYYLARNSKFHAFEKGKKYNFTVTLSKTSSGINVNISQWEDDGIDYGGTAN